MADHAEALRYSWGNGERKLLVAFGAFALAMAGLIVGLSINLFHGASTDPPNPYEIQVPGPAEPLPDGRLRLVTKRCNTTNDIIVVDIETSWLHIDGDGRNLLIPGSPLAGIAVRPGGSLCDPPTMDPIISSVVIPEEVQAEGGSWVYQSQITVSECLIGSIGEDGRAVCDEQGEVIDNVGWYSEEFTVR